MKQRVSIIVPVRDGERTLAACIEACLGQTYPNREVIVVDDGSTDASGRITRDFPVHYVRQEPRGPAAARNRGATLATGSILAFTDADCVPASDWIERLLAGFKENVVAVGGTYTNAAPERWLARVVHEEIVGRHSGLGKRVDFLGSFNVAYDKAAFDSAGGFDENFRAASGEDNDLAYRLIDAGGSLRFEEGARVAHYHPTRLGSYLRAQARHGFWRMKLYAKHPGRMRGDRYAGAGSLFGPPLALALGLIGAVTIAGTLWSGEMPSLGWATLALLGAWTVLHAPRTVVLIKRTGNIEMAGYLPLALARDLARAVGMARGVWTFQIRRGRTA